MIAGHLILGVFFAGTVYLITQPKTLAFGVGAGLMSIVLVGFELLVAGLQAYIFTILTADYLAGALQPELSTEHSNTPLAVVRRRGRSCPRGGVIVGGVDIHGCGPAVATRHVASPQPVGGAPDLGDEFRHQMRPPVSDRPRCLPAHSLRHCGPGRKRRPEDAAKGGDARGPPW
jgi:hypothetical protein